MLSGECEQELNVWLYLYPTWSILTVVMSHMMLWWWSWAWSFWVLKSFHTGAGGKRLFSFLSLKKNSTAKTRGNLMGEKKLNKRFRKEPQLKVFHTGTFQGSCTLSFLFQECSLSHRSCLCSLWPDCGQNRKSSLGKVTHLPVVTHTSLPPAHHCVFLSVVFIFFFIPPKVIEHSEPSPPVCPPPPEHAYSFSHFLKFQITCTTRIH